MADDWKSGDLAHCIAPDFEHPNNDTSLTPLDLIFAPKKGENYRVREARVVVHPDFTTPDGELYLKLDGFMHYYAARLFKKLDPPPPVEIERQEREKELA